MLMYSIIDSKREEGGGGGGHSPCIRYGQFLF